MELCGHVVTIGQGLGVRILVAAQGISHMVVVTWGWLRPRRHAVSWGPCGERMRAVWPRLGWSCGGWAASLSRSGSVEPVGDSDDVGSVPVSSSHWVFVATLSLSGRDSACIIVVAQGLCGHIVATAQGLCSCVIVAWGLCGRIVVAVQGLGPGSSLHEGSMPGCCRVRALGPCHCCSMAASLPCRSSVCPCTAMTMWALCLHHRCRAGTARFVAVRGLCGHVVATAQGHRAQVIVAWGLCAQVVIVHKFVAVVLSHRGFCAHVIIAWGTLLRFAGALGLHHCCQRGYGTQGRCCVVACVHAWE